MDSGDRTKGRVGAEVRCIDQPLGGDVTRTTTRGVEEEGIVGRIVLGTTTKQTEDVKENGARKRKEKQKKWYQLLL